MRPARRAARVDRDAHRAVRRVFEASGHRQRGRELAVHLRLGCARANRAPRNEVGRVLGGDGIQELAARRQAQLRDVQEKSAREPEALVDLEAAVHLRIVDEALPADSRTRLLEVDTHDDVKVLFCGFGVVAEEPRVFFCRFHIVDRARSVKQLILSICAEF